MAEVHMVGLFVHLEHWEIDHPNEFEAVIGDQAQISAQLGARRPGELHKGLGIACHEEGSVPLPQTQLTHDRVGGF